VTKLHATTMFTSEVMNCQMHAIEKAIRPLFADPVQKGKQACTVTIYHTNNLTSYIAFI